MNRNLACLLSAAVGFVALSWEILWYRIYAFVSRGSPAAFGVLLGAYLLGIAFGASMSRHFCRPDSADPALDRKRIAKLIATAAGISFLVAPALSWMVIFLPWVFSLILVALAAAMLGASFPLLSHLAIPADDRAGYSLSLLYLANIIGSALGSLVTGFFFMDLLPFAGIAITLLILGLGLSLAVMSIGARGPKEIKAATVLTLMTLIGSLLGTTLHDGMYERLLRKTDYESGERFTRLLENRHGVIAIDDKQVVYGGGVFDGVVSTDILSDENWILRPYALSGLNRRPKHALLIGLSMGAWSQIVVNLEDLEKLTIIEINPGYEELIAEFPQVRSLLKNPKVEIVIDDGRRWLSRHKDRKFDLIVQNTTWHWRAHATNLLSVEYMEMCRRAMNKDGVIIFNTTFSEDAMRSGMAVFDHGFRYYNNMILSPEPLRLNINKWRQSLIDFRIDGKKVIDVEYYDHQQRMASILSTAREQSPALKEGIEYLGSLKARIGTKPVVTDDNMLCEFRELQW